MEVESIEYNWCQVGNIHNGVDPQVEIYQVGVNGVVEIHENAPSDGLEVWNYKIIMEDGSSVRIFNPNKAIYFKQRI